MARRLATAFVVLACAGVGLLSSVPAAGAADSHWIAGTYQLYIQGYGNQTLVLSGNHGVGPPSDAGSWSVEKSEHEITVDVPGGRAPITACEDAGQGPFCNFSDQYRGPKTSTGIASQSDPGVADAYLGGYLVLTEPCWAVRTGRA